MKYELITALLIILIIGCTASNTGNNTNVNVSKWSAKVNALGEPTYQDVNVTSGFVILPFPGLAYNGLRSGFEAFYSTNKDYTFAIYVTPNVNNSGRTYAQVKTDINQKYNYFSSLTCVDVTSSTWLTQAQVFSCTYTDSTNNINYKSVIFYKNQAFIETILSVWGTTPLSNYEYLFDEFNQKAVSWN
jgi:hypothetical protein